MGVTEISVITLAFFGVAQAVARATKTKRDDLIVSKIGKVLSFIFSKTNEG
jgi:hypothetical protein